MPNEPHHHEIEDGKDDERYRMRAREFDDLIEYEKPENRERRRIRPELASQEPRDERPFNEAVAEKVDGTIELRSGRYAARERLQMRRQKIRRVFHELLRDERVHYRRDVYEKEQYAKACLEERVQAFEHNAYLEYPVDISLFWALRED